MTAIGILGDVDGRVYHALALVLTWQHFTQRRLDLVVQLGNMTAFPHEQAALAAAFNETFETFP